MDDLIKLSASVVSIPGDRQDEEGGFFIDGRFKQSTSTDNTIVSIENSDSFHLFSVSSNMNATGHRDSEISINNELDRFFEQKSHKSDFDAIFNELFELVEETKNITDSMNKGDFSNHSGFAGMAIRNNYAGIITSGDTRAYIYRNGVLKQLTADYRKTERLLKLGIISDNQAEALNERYGIPSESEKKKIKKTETFEIMRGDAFLLSNTGIIDNLDELTLSDIISMRKDTGIIASTVIKEMLKKNNYEGTVILAVRIEEAGKLTNVNQKSINSSIYNNEDEDADEDEYNEYYTRKTQNSSRQRIRKIKKIIRLAVSSLVIFGIIFGLFAILDRLFFGKDDGKDVFQTDATTTTETSEYETEETTGESEEQTETSITETTRNTSPSTATSTDLPVKYVIKSGDSLMGISRKFYGDASKYTVIQKYNNIKDSNNIIVGQEIVIPSLEGQ